MKKRSLSSIDKKILEKHGIVYETSFYRLAKKVIVIILGVFTLVLTVMQFTKS